MAVVDVLTIDPNAAAGMVDAVPAIIAALAMSPRIYLPSGTYRLASTLRPTRAVLIEGDGGGSGTPRAQTLLLPDPGVSAIAIEPVAAGSKIRDLGVRGPKVSIWHQDSAAWRVDDFCRSSLTVLFIGALPHALPFVFKRLSGTLTGAIEPPWRDAFDAGTLKAGDIFPDGDGEWLCVQVNGIKMSTLALLEDVLVTAMPSNWLHLQAATDGTPSTNANGWATRGGRFSENDGWGIYISGIDTNAYHVQHPGLYGNGLGGICDLSQHGGTIDTPVIEGNSGPVIRIDSAISTTVVLDPYVEANQPKAIGAGQAIVVGGNLSKPAGGQGFETGRYITEFGSFSSTLTTLNRDGPHSIVSSFGRPGVDMVAFEIVDLSPWNVSESVQLRRSLETGALELYVGGNVIYQIPLADSVDPARFVAPLGIQIGTALETTNAQLFFTGRRNVGDRLRFTDVPNASFNIPTLTPGGPEGLICVRAGNVRGEGALNAIAWAPNTEFSVGALIVPTTGGPFVYRVCNVTPNSPKPWKTGATEPVWPQAQFGQQVIDDRLVFQLFDWATQRAEFKPFGAVAM